MRIGEPPAKRCPGTRSSRKWVTPPWSLSEVAALGADSPPWCVMPDRRACQTIRLDVEKCVRVEDSGGEDVVGCDGL
jgi:hypothetical protein